MHRNFFSCLKQIGILSYPLLMTKVSIPLRGFIVIWILSRLDGYALSAGGLTYSFLMVLLTFLLGVLTASVGISLAYAIGEKTSNEVATIFQQGLWFGLFLSIPMMFILHHIDYLLLLFKQDSHLAQLAKSFSEGLVWIFFPYTVVANVSQLLVNLKKSHWLMSYSILGLSITFFFAEAFTFGKWGFAEMGIKGIGWSMVFAYGLQAIVMVIHIALLKKYSILKTFFYPTFSWMKKLWWMGWSVGTKYNVEFLLFFVIGIILGRFYFEELSVYQVVLQFFMLSSCLSTAVGLATEMLVGQAMGNRQFDDAKLTAYAGLWLTGFYMSVVVILVAVFQRDMARLFFTSDLKNFSLLLKVLGVVMVLQLLDSFCKVITDILVAFKNPLFPLLSEILGLWMLSLPLGYLLAIYYQQGLMGFLWALIVGLMAMMSMMGYQLRYRFKIMAHYHHH